VVVYSGRRRGWRARSIFIGAFFLTFICVMVYSFFVRVPAAYATRPDMKLQQENLFFIYEDHIGRPVRMTEFRDIHSNGYEYDGSGNLYWKAAYEPFGKLYDDFDSVGFGVGSGDNRIYWEPPFRFPGQYSDPELLDKFVYNHWRFYMPEIGRYTGPDKLDTQEGLAPYLYAMSNPVTFIDPMGLRLARGGECTDLPCRVDWEAFENLPSYIFNCVISSIPSSNAVFSDSHSE